MGSKYFYIHNNNIKLVGLSSYHQNPIDAELKEYSPSKKDEDQWQHLINIWGITIGKLASEFLSGDATYTIGKAIRVVFLDTNSNSDENKPSLDLKKSGDYIIVGATHSFFGEALETTLLLGKIASLGVEIQI